MKPFNVDAIVLAITLLAAASAQNDTSVFANYDDAKVNGQMFMQYHGMRLDEVPGLAPKFSNVLYWCSDLVFPDPAVYPFLGYVGRCVAKPYGIEDESGQNFVKSVHALTISAIYVDQTDVFEGVYHGTSDDWTARFWDNGDKFGSPTLAWEGDDVGEKHPTSAFSMAFVLEWLTQEEAAALNLDFPDSMTPETFPEAYEKAWNGQHESDGADSSSCSKTTWKTLWTLSMFLVYLLQ